MVTLNLRRRATLQSCLIGGVATLALAGCGARLPSAGAAREAAKAAPTRAQEAPQSPDADMVSAVAAAKSGTGFNLKFSIKDRPAAGQPVEIDIVLTPAVACDRVQVVFRGNDGLEIRSGGSMSPVEKPDPHVLLHHTLTVVPKSEGIFSVSAVVLSDSAEGSLSRAYAIPVIVGGGLAPPVEANAVADGGTAEADAARPPTT